MPYTIVMQDWVRIHGPGSSATTVQDEAHWLDIGGFQGLTPWIQVGFFGGSPVLSLETSPSRDDKFFQVMSAMAGVGVATSSYAVSASGLQAVNSFDWANATGGAPPGKWLRWKITGGANWRAVFRITLTALQGRGGSFKHATVPLPEDARKHPDDHAHAAQAHLRMRAVLAAIDGGYAYGSREPPPDPDDVARYGVALGVPTTAARLVPAGGVDFLDQSVEAAPAEADEDFDENDVVDEDSWSWDPEVGIPTLPPDEGETDSSTNRRTTRMVDAAAIEEMVAAVGRIAGPVLANQTRVELERSQDADLQAWEVLS